MRYIWYIIDTLLPTQKEGLLIFDIILIHSWNSIK
jgi:hypothetical protein